MEKRTFLRVENGHSDMKIKEKDPSQNKNKYQTRNGKTDVPESGKTDTRT